ncbi:hypothetical protein TGDOM2_285820 [Toxoplasma gondii GAB2-2007-GAL-DOM2]|uniref:Uncharacterized protein n=3 Tax=Toxoplasma gondii TaxID=5811 RepID=V4Z9J5_TOXGV|nr:hypothetical protein TGVEG_285820 [Toxoplasma gondii VEG]KFG39999.1 hypothetical protein TGDOM2_285820 [Toxoplasma gondii GAB2-2007-GAL-DOM2]KFG44923.1 hypothetical protein TGP89_285820 [Toxoplasma gondii p89]
MHRKEYLNAAKKGARRTKPSERGQFRSKRTKERQRSSSPKQNDDKVGRVTQSCMTPSPRQAQARPEKCTFLWRKQPVQTPYQLRHQHKETNDVGNKKFRLNRPAKHLMFAQILRHRERSIEVRPDKRSSRWRLFPGRPAGKIGFPPLFPVRRSFGVSFSNE